MSKSNFDPVEKLRSFEPKRATAISKARAGAPTPASLVQGLRDLKLERLGDQTLDLAAIEIGARLRIARQERGLTQAQLAKRINCNQADVSDIERGVGKDGPSYRKLLAWAKALNIVLPINPPPPSDLDAIVVDAADEALVVSGMGHYWMYYPLLSDHAWAGMRKVVQAKLHTLPLTRQDDRCVLYRVPPSTRVMLKHAPNFTVMASVGGFGKVQVHQAVHRFTRIEPGCPVAVLKTDSAVEVETPKDDGFVFMMLPADILLKEPAADAE